MIFKKMAILCVIVSMPTMAAVKSVAPFSGKDLLTQNRIDVNPQSAEKGTVVIFMSTKCPCSNSHESMIKEIAQEFSDFKFIGIHSNMDESADSAVEHFKRSGLPMPILQDDHAKLADEFKALKTPHVFVISKTGSLLYKGGVTNSHVGPSASRNYLKEVLVALRKGEAPPITEERSLGCMISRKE